MNKNLCFINKEICHHIGMRNRVYSQEAAIKIRHQPNLVREKGDLGEFHKILFSFLRRRAKTSLQSF